MNPEMPSPYNPDQPKEEEIGYRFETTSVNGNIYNVELLESFAEQLESEEVPLEKLEEAVGEGHYYWEDRSGNKLGPSQILKDWEAAQRNEDWADHVATIKRADLSNPIWISADGHVFNGMHRLTRAFIDKVPTIKVKKFSSLPDEAIVRK
jgi:hypothetical protein